jgi:hypothetical protein
MKKKTLLFFCAALSIVSTMMVGYGQKAVKACETPAAPMVMSKPDVKSTALSANTLVATSGLMQIAANTKTKTPEPTKAPAKEADMSKYLVYTKADWDGDKTVDLFDKYYEGEHGNPNTDASILSGRVYYNYPDNVNPEIINVYEFTKRPAFAGKARTVTLSDKDLLPEDLLKYNLQVGDTVITKSFTYEQDGNTQNGKEPIEWNVERVQIIYTMYGTDFSYAQAKLRGKGANVSASYYMVAKNTLDYDEYFKFENWTQLYTGKSLTNQKYSNKLVKKDGRFKGFVFDSLQGVDVDFTISDSHINRFCWNTCNTTAYTGMMSIYKFAGRDTKSKPTEYALSKKTPITKNGYAKYNWLYGTSPYYIDSKDIMFRALSVSFDGNLRWNHPFTDLSGFRPEMTLWTGIDTATARKTGDPFDISLSQLKDGSWRKKYEINYNIWKVLEDFVTWKIK